VYINDSIVTFSSLRSAPGLMVKFFRYSGNYGETIIAEALVVHGGGGGGNLPVTLLFLKSLSVMIPIG